MAAGFCTSQIVGKLGVIETTQRKKSLCGCLLRRPHCQSTRRRCLKIDLSLQCELVGRRDSVPLSHSQNCVSRRQCAACRRERQVAADASAEVFLRLAEFTHPDDALAICGS